MDEDGMRSDTRITHGGRSPEDYLGAVNVPVYRTSTVLFPSLADLRQKETAKVRYGRRGVPTVFALEEAVSSLEGSDRVICSPSGLNAISTVLTCYSKPGAHLLVADNAYGPTRKFCTFLNTQFGVEVEYYDPDIGAGIEALIRPTTKLIWMESPGSQTFEVHDIPAIVAAARKHDVVTAIDSTWGAGYFLKPIALGVDIAVQSATKYLSGHSDVMFGTIACSQKHYDALQEVHLRFGICVSPDDAYLVSRGMRTLGVRMRQHHENALVVARWLAQREEVIRVMHPALDSDPYHDLWRQQFTGASGLFGFVMRDTDPDALARFFDGLRIFGMGASWGGFESLLIPTDPTKLRSATAWNPGGQTMRIHVGLEDPQDLIDDLQAGFERLNSPAGRAEFATAS